MAQRGWEALQRIGWSIQKPRSRHVKAATPEQEAEFKKKLEAVVAEEAERRPDLPVEVFATDEHRLGLKPVLRRVWAPKGQRPIALGHHRYKWLYVTLPVPALMFTHRVRCRTGSRTGCARCARSTHPGNGWRFERLNLCPFPGSLERSKVQ